MGNKDESQSSFIAVVEEDEPFKNSVEVDSSIDAFMEPVMMGKVFFASNRGRGWTLCSSSSSVDQRRERILAHNQGYDGDGYATITSRHPSSLQ